MQALNYCGIISMRHHGQNIKFKEKEIIDWNKNLMRILHIWLYVSHECVDCIREIDFLQTEIFSLQAQNFSLGEISRELDFENFFSLILQCHNVNTHLSYLRYQTSSCSITTRLERGSIVYVQLIKGELFGHSYLFSTFTGYKLSWI